MSSEHRRTECYQIRMESIAIWPKVREQSIAHLGFEGGGRVGHGRLVQVGGVSDLLHPRRRGTAAVHGHRGDLDLREKKQCLIATAIN